jgi:hypothetical protein
MNDLLGMERFGDVPDGVPPVSPAAAIGVRVFLASTSVEGMPLPRTGDSPPIRRPAETREAPGVHE